MKFEGHTTYQHNYSTTIEPKTSANANNKDKRNEFRDKMRKSSIQTSIQAPFRG